MAKEASTEHADEILAALAVDLRRRLLREIDAGTQTPKDLAAVFGIPLPNVAYHVKILRDAGLIELTRTEPRRGAVAHFFKRSRRNAKRVDELLAIADRLS